MPRIRELIQNEIRAGTSYERKYDVVVKIEEIQPPANWDQVDRVVLKVTDHSNILFSLTLSSKILLGRKPGEQIEVGQIVRIVKLHKTQD